jgi:hypothetical protein
MDVIEAYSASSTYKSRYKYYYYVIIECQHFYIITTVNVELNISNNKLTKNESQACTDIMCTDILTGKMIDGNSMLHESSMATSKKPVYKGPHQLLTHYVSTGLRFICCKLVIADIQL